MKLFIGLYIPSNISAELILLQKKIHSKHLKINWTPKKKLHLTLKFIGDFDSKNLPRLIKSLNSVKFYNFTIQLDGIGAFPSMKSPKVLWVGLKKNKKIQNLKKNIDSKFSLKKTENTPYIPHITLGRIKEQVFTFSPSSEIADLYLTDKIIEVNRFSLIESTQTDKGSIYKIIQTFQSSDFGS